MRIEKIKNFWIRNDLLKKMLGSIAYQKKFEICFKAKSEVLLKVHVAKLRNNDEVIDAVHLLAVEIEHGKNIFMFKGRVKRKFIIRVNTNLFR